MKIIIVFIFAAFFVSCEKKTDTHHLQSSQNENFTAVETLKSENRVHIPNIFWEVITGENLKENANNSKTYSFFLEEYQVQLNEKTKGVLKNTPQMLRIQKGGGLLDLGNYLTGQQGSFYLEFDTKTTEDEEFKIFFYSTTNSKKIDGESWGQDCYKLYDITKFIQKKKSILTNTSNFRHAQLLSGVYLISRKRKNNFFISAFELKDSRYSLSACVNKKE